MRISRFGPILLFCSVAGIMLTSVSASHSADSTAGSIFDAYGSVFSVASFFGALLSGVATIVDYRSDVPWVNTDKGDLWSERQIRRLTDYIDRGSGDWSKLGRTLIATAPIAALGILFYGEDSFRNLGIFDAARYGSQ